MSSKPTLANSRWATSSSNLTAPSNGKRDSGFEPNEQPPCDYDNVLFREAYLWHEYLDDGDLDGDHTIDGNLTVTGTITGTLKHGDQVLTLMATNGSTISGTWDTSNTTYALCTSTGAWVLAIPLREGDRVKSVTFGFRRAFGTVTFDVSVFDGATFATSSIGSNTVTTGTSDAQNVLNVTDTVLGTGDMLYCTIDGVTNLRFYYVLVTYDRP